MHHGWLVSSIGNSTYADQNSPQGALGLKDANPGSVSGCHPVGLGLKYCQSCPKSHLCSPPSCHQMAATCKYTQPGYPPGELLVLLSPLCHFSACRASPGSPRTRSHCRHRCNPTAQLQPSLLSLAVICCCSILLPPPKYLFFPSVCFSSNFCAMTECYSRILEPLWPESPSRCNYLCLVRL